MMPDSAGMGESLGRVIRDRGAAPGVEHDNDVSIDPAPSVRVKA